MFEIWNVVAEGFDRAIIAMRRENGGREVSDSEWTFDAKEGGCFFEIGEDDKAECLRLLKVGDYDFMKYIGVWAHIKAPAEWWDDCGGYFIAQSDVKRKGDDLTRSIFTTYGHLRSLAEMAHENSDDWQAWDGLRKALEELHESWMILDEMEA